MESLLPESYESWKHCITVLCGIRLTEAVIRERLAALQAPAHPQTEQFTRLYGEAYTQQVTGWFRQALQAYFPN